MQTNNKLNEYGDILTPKEVRDILGIGYNKTYQLLKTGTIKNFKIGRDIKIPKTYLEAYIYGATPISND